jgi:hypothetical protein
MRRWFHVALLSPVQVTTSTRTAGQRDHQAFRQQLPHEPRPRSPQRQPHRQLPPPARGPGQQADWPRSRTQSAAPCRLRPATSAAPAGSLLRSLRLTQERARATASQRHRACLDPAEWRSAPLVQRPPSRHPSVAQYPPGNATRAAMSPTDRTETESTHPPCDRTRSRDIRCPDAPFPLASRPPL